MKTKKCPHCKTVKPLDEFYKGRRKPDGGYYASSYCKPCSNYKYRHHEVDLPLDELAAEGEKLLSEANF